MESIVFFKHQGQIKPIIKVKEILNQDKAEIIVAFIPFEGEHISLHLQKDGSILRTHYSKNKSKSVWDDTRIKIASYLNYKDTIRHGKYFVHSRLVKLSNVNEYHLAGRRITLDQVDEGNKYKAQKYKNIIVKAPISEFMLDLYLSTLDNKRTSKNKISTFLGDIIFDLKRHGYNS